MNSNQNLIQELGNILWSLSPHDAQVINIKCFCYPDVQGLKFNVFIKNTKKSLPITREYQSKILSILENLKKDKHIIEKSWTHLDAKLTELGQLHLEFVDIPYEDSSFGLYMQGVSELTEEEADANYISEKTRQEHLQRFGEGKKYPIFTIEQNISLDNEMKGQAIPTPFKPIVVDENQDSYTIVGQVMGLIFPENAQTLYCDFRIHQGVMSIGLIFLDQDGLKHDIATDAVINHFSVAEASNIICNYLLRIHEYDQSQHDDWERILVQRGSHGGVFFQTEFD